MNCEIKRFVTILCVLELLEITSPIAVLHTWSYMTSSKNIIGIIFPINIGLILHFHRGLQNFGTALLSLSSNEHWQYFLMWCSFCGIVVHWLRHQWVRQSDSLSLLRWMHQYAWNVPVLVPTRLSRQLFNNAWLCKILRR
jgi:hypothetical protein